MTNKDVKIGSVYLVKVSGKICPVKIISESSWKGWEGINLETGRSVYIKSVRRLRQEIKR